MAPIAGAAGAAGAAGDAGDAGAAGDAGISGLAGPSGPAGPCIGLNPSVLEHMRLYLFNIGDASMPCSLQACGTQDWRPSSTTLLLHMQLLNAFMASGSIL
jgi:hypothetical protein